MTCSKNLSKCLQRKSRNQSRKRSGGRKNHECVHQVYSCQMLWWFREYAEKAGWKYGQLLTWCKPNFCGHPGGISADWNMMSEQILLFRKGKRTPMLNSDHISTTHNWFVEPVPQSNFNDGRIHPAQMSLRLCKKIISRSPGEPVLDPFTGSGQVLRAAKALGRPYIGIELVPQVAERARSFVANSQQKQTRGQAPLFAPPSS
jgi:hypothetical protein